MQVQLGGQPPHGQRGVVTVTVLNAKGKPVKGAAVRLARRRREHAVTRRTNKKGVVTVLGQADPEARQPHGHGDQEAFKIGTMVVADLVVPAGCRAERPGTPARPAPPQWRR